MPNQRKITCPNCADTVLVKKSGRIFASVGAFLQRSFNIRVPTEVVEYIKDKTPVEKTRIFKEKCPVCDGTKKILDPSDDRNRFTESKQIASDHQEEIEKLEAKLGPAGGSRYTVIQGSDLLEVGLGMNSASSYRIDKNKSIRNKGLLDPAKITEKGAPQIPEGGRCNHIQGINSLSTPGGHYMIKCSNKFTVVTGAQGIEMTTNGPINISGGITKITAPEISIGTQVGRLSLYGDVVDIGGKSIEVAPTDGHLFVKGTISNTGNLMVGGHAHCESVSFVKGECVGRNELTKISAPCDLFSGPAFWGGEAPEALERAIKDMSGFVLSKSSNPVESQQMMTPRFVESLTDKILNIVYCMRPWEFIPTGYIIEGTLCKLNGEVPCNVGGSARGDIIATVTEHIPVHNFPHIHALPDMTHFHDVRIPDIDCSSDTAAQLRARQSGVSSPSPLHKPSSDLVDANLELFEPMGETFVSKWAPITKDTYLK